MKWPRYFTFVSSNNYFLCNVPKLELIVILQLTANPLFFDCRPKWKISFKIYITLYLTYMTFLRLKLSSLTKNKQKYFMKSFHNESKIYLVFPIAN